MHFRFVYLLVRKQYSGVRGLLARLDLSETNQRVGELNNEDVENLPQEICP